MSDKMLEIAKAIHDALQAWKEFSCAFEVLDDVMNERTGEYYIELTKAMERLAKAVKHE